MKLHEALVATFSSASVPCAAADQPARDAVAATPLPVDVCSFPIARAGALVLLFLFALPFTAHAQNCVPGTTPDWMVTSDQLAAAIRPAECTVVEQSPPDFGWPSTGGSYQLTLTYPNGSTKSVSTTKNWVNWSEVLPAGTYKWQVTSNGTPSRTRQFAVASNATPFLVPATSTVLSQLSAKARPRGLPNAATLSTMKSQRSSAVNALLNDVRSMAKQPLPGISGGDPKADSEAALQAVAAAVYSAQGIYYNEAIRRVVNLSSWDPKGSTSYASNANGARAVAWALAVGYDWLYPKLSSAQKNQILAALKVRVGDMYNDVMASVERRPRDSSRNQSLVVTAVIAALIAPDLPEATTWLNASLPLAINSINPWAGDEGGFGNGLTQGFWDVGEQLLPWYVLRWSTGIDVAKKAWVRNWARYMAFFEPVGTPAQVFGDGFEMDLTENRARFGKGYTYFAPTPLGRWYASKLSSEDQTGLEYLMAPPADFTTAGFPAGTPDTLMLPTIGQVAMHSDLANPARTSVYFKSSPAPYGAFDHSHAAQNSFVVNSGGQRLAIETGYYDGYKTSHWLEWYHQTRAKNAITYDGGKGQAFYEQGGTMGFGGLTGHAGGADYEIVTGDATAAYGGALSKAERSMVYLRPNLILVYDNLASDIGRQWEWNIHSLNAMNVVSGSKVSIENNGQTLCVDVLSGPPRRFEQTDHFTADPSGTHPRQWHGKFYSTELLPATEFLVLLNVGCTTATSSATKTDGVWTVKVNDKTVQISDAAITVNGYGTEQKTSTPTPGPASTTSSPYSGTPVTIPSTLEAENFDKGGEGVGYYDTSAGNAGAVYRTGEDVDIIASTDTLGGGYVVNNFATGEWLAYTINAPTSGQYVVQLRASNNYTAASAFHLEIDGAKVTGSIPVPMTGSWNTFQSVAAPAISLAAGKHVLKVVADQQYFNVNSIAVTASSAPASGSSPTPTASAPYSGTPIAIPGAFEAENFDKGGEGVAYHDTTASNAGGVYRTSEGVDLIVSNDSLGGGYVVNNFATGEWLGYTVNVATTGQYVVKLRTSNAYTAAGSFHVEVDGAKVTGSIPVPLTGSWSSFQWVAAPAISLPAGKHVLKVVADQQYFNLNSISVEAASASAPTPSASTPYTGTAIAVPVAFEAENFDKGGEGVAYHDTTAGNAGAVYRTTEDVDMVASTDSLGGGYIVNNFSTGEWLAYTINVPTSGQYLVQLRASNNFSAASAFHIEIDGAKVTGSVPVPMTGGWNTFQWVAAPAVTLASGKHVLKVVADQQYFNLNSISVTAATSTGSNGGSTGITGSTSGAKLLFSSGFEGSTALSAPTSCFTTGCWQNVTGTDTSTGFSWPPSIGSVRPQLIVGTPVTASNIGNYIENQIQTVTGHKGTSTRAFYSALKQRGSGYCCTQDTFMLQPTSDPRDLYVSYWMKYQPDLVQSMNNQWRMLFEWKTSGDYRVTARVATYGGATPYWIVIGDNNAGGGDPYKEFFKVENRSVPVPVGQWFKFETYWHRSSGSDGRVWMAINGRTIADRYGPNIGARGDPINRVMMPNLYTDGTYPAYQWIDDIEIWSGFPPVGNNPPYAPH